MIEPVTAMNTLQSNPISQSDIDDVNIQSMIPLVTPAQLKTELPLTENAYQTVLKGRETIRNIL
ncbi:MAG TPA: 3-deoxy-7-phosphoheptulonate synthase, partial [Acinetobacter schindleri]|nr:3-deoxy-7-phosphoheptulonate synthase [Acinetobacter schindleri]